MSQATCHRLLHNSQFTAQLLVILLKYSNASNGTGKQLISLLHMSATCIGKFLLSVPNMAFFVYVANESLFSAFVEQITKVAIEKPKRKK